MSLSHPFIPSALEQIDAPDVVLGIGEEHREVVNGTLQLVEEAGYS